MVCRQEDIASADQRVFRASTHDMRETSAIDHRLARMFYEHTKLCALVQPE
jgi:hypothetical protein